MGKNLQTTYSKNKFFLKFFRKNAGVTQPKNTLPS